MKEPGPEHRAYTRTAIVTRLRDADNYSYFDACRGADALEELEAENDALRAKLEAAEMHKAAAPLCEKHAPNGGARSGCLVCSGMRLSGALSEIDYICGEPNDMGCSGYDVHCDEDAVVENVRKLQARVRELQQYHDWAAPQIERPVEQSVIAENNALSAKLESLQRDLAARDVTIAEMRERVKDYEDDYAAVVDEPCAPDEKHCTCVPILRRRIKELTAAEAKRFDLACAWRDTAEHIKAERDALRARAEAAVVIGDGLDKIVKEVNRG